MECLGHIVSGEGVASDPSKVAAVENFPIPTDVKALCSFLGLAAYYRKFVPNFKMGLSPFSTHLKKHPISVVRIMPECF